MIVLERTRQALETLGLAQAVAVLDSRLETAAARQSTYLDFLNELLEAELTVRRHHSGPQRRHLLIGLLGRHYWPCYWISLGALGA